jgi:uncharacterized membrane protein YbhN (UPF0104 family)
VAFSGFGIKFSLPQSIFGNALAALTFLVPSAPGYVGSAEASGLAVFGGVLGVDANIASAAIILFHVLTLIMLLFWGFVGIYLLKFDLGLVWKKLRGQ